jgi:histidinol-phosphate aminotransferase
MDTPLFQNLIHPKVKNLTPYLPGRSIKEIQKQYQIQDVIKLASNENPLGCSPKVLENIHQTTVDNIFIYPSTGNHPLIENLTSKLDIAKENLLIANGSDAIFSLLIQAYALPYQKQILTHQFAFMGYEIQALGYGIETLKASIHPESWQVNIDELILLAKKNVTTRMKR